MPQLPKAEGGREADISIHKEYVPSVRTCVGRSRRGDGPGQRDDNTGAYAHPGQRNRRGSHVSRRCGSPRSSFLISLGDEQDEVAVGNDPRSLRYNRTHESQDPGFPPERNRAKGGRCPHCGAISLIPLTLLLDPATPPRPDGRGSASVPDHTL